jgi:hypothetical protein
MALVWNDRVLETSNTTGTGAFTLAAAVSGYQRFADAMSTNDTCYYFIDARDGNGNPSGAWESGLGTYSGTNTLTRTTVHQSSNGDAAVNFAAGTKYVALTITARSMADLGTATVTMLVSDPAGSAITTGDGKAFYRVPSTLNGMSLIACAAVLDTAGTGGGFLCQLRRKRSGSDVDMLSTRISIDSGENDSADGTPPAINASNDDVATGDRIYIDLDGVPTGGKGLAVEMQFRP